MSGRGSAELGGEQEAGSGRTLRPRAILEVLHRHRVDYVLIGGVGARLWGSPLLTDDLDLCPSTKQANLERLAAALNELRARCRVEGLAGGFEALVWEARSFSGHLAASLTLATTSGPLDVWFRPDGTRGYADLIGRARELPLEGLTTWVADLDDIIRSKEAAGRDKDLAALPLLRTLRRQRRQRRNG